MSAVAAEAATCVECGQPFSFRPRGIKQLTCSGRCRLARRERTEAHRRIRFLLAHTPIGALGRPDRLICGSVSADALHGERCEELADVVYLGRDGTAYLVCRDHDSHAASEAAAAMGLRRVELVP